MTVWQRIIIIALCILGTMLTRFLPFILFQKNTPKTVYCLRNVQLFSGNQGLPEFLSLGLTILMHCWKRNMLLSIFSGTVLYMLFQQGILALPF